MGILAGKTTRRIGGRLLLLVLLSLFFEIFYSLFLFPCHVLYLLVLIEEAIDVDVCIVQDTVAKLAIGFWVAGGVFVQAIQGDRFPEQDRIEADHLIGCEVGYSLLQHFELMDGLLNRPGWMRRFGRGLGMRSQGCGQYIG